MRVALVQMSIDSESRSTNQRRSLELLCKAAETTPPPEVVCFPARSDCAHVDDSTATTAMTDAFVEVVAAKARELGISVVFGFADFAADALYDAAVWCDADGDTVIRHRRVRLTDDDSRFAAGHAVRLAETIFGPVGVLVGPDGWCPELVGTVRTMGAPILFMCCHEAGLPTKDIAALAKQYGLWFVVTNASSASGANGSSHVVAPDGTTRCSAQAEEEIIHCDIDMEFRNA